MTAGFNTAGYDQAVAEARDCLAYCAQRLAMYREHLGNDKGLAAWSVELYEHVPAIHLASWLAVAVAKLEEAK